MCHLKSLLCTALCSSLISIFKTIFDEKICKGKGWALEQNSFWKCFESYGIVHSWKIWFHEIYQFKSGASFHVWQIILIFGCKLMVFLPLPLGKKRHFTNYYGAGQRHLCLLASVLAWHIGPLTQMPEEGKERGDNTLLMQCEIYEKSHKFMWLAFFKPGLKLNWAIGKSSHSEHS